MDDRELDNFIEEIAVELRRPERIDASFDAKVLAALEPTVLPLRAREATRPSRSWLFRPRTFSLTPLTGLAVAAALAGIAVLGVWRASQSNAPTAQPQLALTPVANVKP